MNTNNKFSASKKLSLIAAGALIAGTASTNAEELNILDYSSLGTASELRAELLSTNSTEFIQDLAAYELNCGENTCGEGKCGEGEEEEGEEGEEEEGKEEEGKCGEGKCGEGKCGEA